MNNIILPAKMPLNDMSWQGIQTVAKAGKASEYWKPGDSKAIVIDGEVAGVRFRRLSIDVFILGIGHNPDTEGQDHIHFGIGMMEGDVVGLADKNNAFNEHWSRLNSGRRNSGGWEKSEMRTQVLGADGDPSNPTKGTLLTALPRSLRQVMVPITKYTDNVGGGSNEKTNVTATKDVLWLLSEYEVYGTRFYANRYESLVQAQYDFFKINSGDSITKYYAPMEPAYTLCRSPWCGNIYDFCTALDWHDRLKDDAQPVILAAFAV